MGVEQLLEEQATLLEQGSAIAEKYRSAGKLEPEERDDLGKVDVRLKEIDEELEAARSTVSVIDGIKSRQDAARAAGRKGLYPGVGDPDPDDKGMRTPGETFTESEQYAGWMQRHPDGGPPEGTTDSSGAAQVLAYRTAMGMMNATEKFRGAYINPAKMRALIGSGSTSAGGLVFPDWRGLLEPGLVRPLTIRQLVTVIPVSSNAIEYAREVSRVYNPGFVAEATAATGTSGTKPEGGLIFEVITAVVKTIAEWVPATKNILSDAPALRAYIDAYLTDDLSLKLEDQMTTGTGGTGFTGILNDPNINVVAAPSGSKNIIDVIRTGKKVVMVQGRTRPTAVLVNPDDAETIDQLKASTSGVYLGGNPYAFGAGNQSLWGMPLVESEAVTAGIALVGDFRRAILFDRESSSVSVGTANDDFLRNIVRVLAEMRAAFAVTRPKAFALVHLT